MTPTNNGTIDPNMRNPSQVSGDPTCPDTAADRAGGQLGMLAQLLRFLIEKLLPPWVYPPPNFRAFDKQGSVPTPAVGASATILSLTVPTGWNMSMRRLSVNIVGGGFVQGSGSLVWGITVDNVPVRDYANIITELGSIQQPRPTDGVLAHSGQVVRVTLSNVSYVAGGTNTVASVGGWFYPRPKRRNHATAA